MPTGAVPGYYLTDPGGLILLPVAERYGAQIGYDQNQIILETERGRRWVYHQFRRTTYELVYRVTTEQLFLFQALHEAVNGSEIPFYFVHDTADLAAAVYGRKEKDYQPKELDEPGWVDGVETAIYDYTFRFTSEPVPGTITP